MTKKLDETYEVKHTSAHRAYDGSPTKSVTLQNKTHYHNVTKMGKKFHAGGDSNGKYHKPVRSATSHGIIKQMIKHHDYKSTPEHDKHIHSLGESKTIFGHFVESHYNDEDSYVGRHAHKRSELQHELGHEVGQPRHLKPAGRYTPSKTRRAFSKKIAYAKTHRVEESKDSDSNPHFDAAWAASKKAGHTPHGIGYSKKHPNHVNVGVEGRQMHHYNYKTGEYRKDLHESTQHNFKVGDKVKFNHPGQKAGSTIQVHGRVIHVHKDGGEHEGKLNIAKHETKSTRYKSWPFTKHHSKVSLDESQPKVQYLKHPEYKVGDKVHFIHDVNTEFPLKVVARGAPGHYAVRDFWGNDRSIHAKELIPHHMVESHGKIHKFKSHKPARQKARIEVKARLADEHPKNIAKDDAAVAGHQATHEPSDHIHHHTDEWLESDHCW